MRKWVYLETSFEEGRIVKNEKVVDEDHLRKVVYPEWILLYMVEGDSEASFERFLDVWAMSMNAIEFTED